MRAVLTMVVAAGVCSCAAQTFQNLGFEQAVIQSNDPTYGFLDWNLAVPGWSHSPGPDTAVVYYPNTHLGGTQAFLLVDRFSRYFQPLQFRYSLAFQSGLSAPDPASSWTSAYISQTGLVPDTAQSLRFLAIGNFAVTVNGNALSTYSFGNNSYGVDITPYAGTVSELKILNTSGRLDFSKTLVDAFTFSSTPVPEPNVLWLFALGAVSAVTARYWRRYG